MQNRNVQIPYELFFQLLQYFLMDNYDGEEIIRLGLVEKNLDANGEIVKYTANTKQAPTEEEREKFRQGNIMGQDGGNTGETFDGKGSFLNTLLQERVTHL